MDLEKQSGALDQVTDSNQSDTARSLDQKGLVRRIDSPQTKVFETSHPSGDHPWIGFAHPDHSPEDFEPLCRHMRHTTIHLKKFWVEVQSCPVFMNSLKNDSVYEVEKIVNWLKSSPSWDSVTQPKAIPELAVPKFRRLLVEFRRDILSARSLDGEIGTQLGPDPSLPLLHRARELVKVYQLENWAKPDLENGITDATSRLKKIEQVISFFSELSARTGAVIPENSHEAKQVLLALDCIRKMPLKIRNWRQKSIVGSNQKIRIQAWQDRARPILAIRKKLMDHFQWSDLSDVDPEKLRKIADELRTPRLFHGLSSDYRDAVRAYRSLILPTTGQAQGKTRRPPREGRLEMVERISEWIFFLEQSESFQANSEARNLFGIHFKGIDTDFATACEANDWAAHVRHEMATDRGESGEDLLAERLTDLILQIDNERLEFALSVAKSDQVRVIRAILDELDFPLERKFVEVRNERFERIHVLNELKNGVSQLGLRNESKFSSLTLLCQLSEDLAFLKNRIEAAAAESPYLKSIYQGLQTDLSGLDESLNYVKFVESADIPDPVRSTFLSIHGPQRLEDTRRLILRSLPSLGAVQDHLEKLDYLTHGQIRSIGEGDGIRSLSIPRMLERIQNALNQSTLLGDWVEQLKREKQFN